MKTLAFGTVVSMLLTLTGLLVSPLQGASAQERPKGIPAGAESAIVTGYEDGDKFNVKVNDKSETVLLISADAPEKGECFADRSASRLEKLLPKNSSVYLERDGDDRDGKDRLLRYAWSVGSNGKAVFVDERMIANGYSTFKAREDNDKYDSRLQKAQSKAQSEKRGLWKDCGGGHVENTPVPKATKVPKVGEKKAPAAIGTTLNTDGQAVTVDSYFYSYDYGYGTPKGGYVFLVIGIRIENVDDSNHGYEEQRFTAEDSVTGADFDSTFVFADQPLGSGELSPGEFVYGQVVLEVQDTANPLLIKFDPSYLGGGEIYWLVTR